MRKGLLRASFAFVVVVVLLALEIKNGLKMR